MAAFVFINRVSFYWYERLGEGGDMLAFGARLSWIVM